MTNLDLAASYLRKAQVRLEVLDLLAFHGDIDFVPSEEYSRSDADSAIEAARFVVGVAARTMGG